jgi:hypothetical protein
LDSFLEELTTGSMKFIYSDKATNLNSFFGAIGEKSLIVFTIPGFPKFDQMDEI